MERTTGEDDPERAFYKYPYQEAAFIVHTGRNLRRGIFLP